MKLSASKKAEIFKELVEKYQGFVMKLTYSYIRDTHRMEDIAQEVFIDAYKSLDRLKDYGKLSGWLKAVTRNKCIDFLKRNNNKIISIDEFSEEKKFDLKDGDDIRSIIYGREKSRNIMKIIDSLPDNQRQVLILRHTEHISYKEIAEMLGTTITALKSLLFRARQTLRKEMGKIEKDRGIEAL